MGRRLEALTNVAILTVAVLAGGVLARNLLSTRAASRPAPLTVGTRLTEPAVDWRPSRATLLMALSPECRFCTESAPFYRRLSAELANRPVRLIALFPPSAENGGEYLRSLGLQIADVRRGAFPSLRIRSTPTLVLVDQDGVVRGVWTGKLSPDAERELIQTVLDPSLPAGRDKQESEESP